MPGCSLWCHLMLLPGDLSLTKQPNGPGKELTTLSSL